MIDHLTTRKLNSIFISLLIVYSLPLSVSSHGRLIQPPGRSTAWRYGFPTTKNYNDNELFCGGFSTQWALNQGKCGICGDSYSGPRDNELPDGKYTKPLVITANYLDGEIVTVRVELTANHRGRFEFRLCPATSEKVEVTQECLDSHVLEVTNSVDGLRYQYTVPDNAQRIYDISLALPNGLTCPRCVLQWTYTAANNWGPCDNGTSAVGCGPQETFRACADVKIAPKEDNETSKYDDNGDEIKEIDNNLDQPTQSTTNRITTLDDEIERESDTPKTTLIHAPKPAMTTTSVPNLLTRETEPITSRPVHVTTTKVGVETSKSWIPNFSPNVVDKVNCIAFGRYRKLPGMDQWCIVNCKAGFCPPSHCKCA